MVVEDDQPLGPAHTLHDLIRTTGKGRFSHWADVVYFSASDNTDPRLNGRRYAAKAKLVLEPGLKLAVEFSFSLIAMVLLWMARHFLVWLSFSALHPRRANPPKVRQTQPFCARCKVLTRGKTPDLHAYVRSRTIRLTSAVVGFTCVFLLIWQPTVEHSIDISSLQHDSGFAYVAQVQGFDRVGYRWLSDTQDKPDQSNLLILENGKRLGPAHSLHDRVRKMGAGSFSHWNGAVVFSASDNTDPQTNGRSYVVLGRLALQPSLFWAGGTVLVAILLMQIWIARRSFAHLVVQLSSEINSALRYAIIRRVAAAGNWLRESHNLPLSIFAIIGAQGLILLLVLWQPIFQYRIDPHLVAHETGNAYVISLSKFAPWGYQLENTDAASLLDDAKFVSKCANRGIAEVCSQSALIVLQDGRPLGPAHAMHSTIRADGGGSFSHWDNTLYFSTPNNTDPRVDGYNYSIQAKYTLDPRVQIPLLLAFSVLLARLFWLSRGWLKTQIGPIKLTAFATMLVIAPWAWSDSIVATLSTLLASHSFALLAQYLILLIVSLAGLAIVPFLQDGRLRISIALVLLAGFAIDRSIFALSGWHSTLELVQTLMREYREASSLFSSYAYTIILNCILVGIIAVVFVLRPPDQWALRRRYSVIPVAALVGAIALTRISTYSAYALPSPFAVLSQFVVAPFFSSDEGDERKAVDYHQMLRPAFKNIIMIVDESVRGDYLGLNNPSYDNTPYLQSATNAIINFGVGVASTNCSAASRLIMRVGLQRSRLPDTEESWRQRPSIWQFAQNAGFKTVLLDGFRLFGLSYHSWMNEAEAKAIDLAFSEVAQPEYQRDVAIAGTLLDLLESDGPMFIYVNKYGAHFPYSTKYPPDINYDSSPLVAKLPLDKQRRDIVARYHKAIRWSVDEFFGRILPIIAARPDTLMIYTSDHGQALFEGGYDSQHCSSNPGLHWGEAMVPIFVFAGPGQFAMRLREQARSGFNQATHFEIFPTLLAAMGYSEDWVSRAYGSSLLQFPLGRRRELLVGAFYGSWAYWIDLDEKISSVVGSGRRGSDFRDRSKD
jgi:glucan phosphoethanolaminetransferase (alkaline phosphatase superfamily)